MNPHALLQPVCLIDKADEVLRDVIVGGINLERGQLPAYREGGTGVRRIAVADLESLGLLQDPEDRAQPADGVDRAVRDLHELTRDLVRAVAELRTELALERQGRQ